MRLKEADAFQRLVSVKMVSVWGVKRRLKEADAFQRLVLLVRSPHAHANIVPQRSRRLSASGILRSRRAVVDSHQASKKQTPFSVWYAPMTCPEQREHSASKKQTPFSVWYKKARLVRGCACEPPQRSRRLSASGILAASDRRAAQFAPQRSRRLSASGIPQVAPTETAGEQPQRSRRLSASGMDSGGRAVRAIHCTSKKQTPFSVWYCASPRGMRHVRRSDLKEADAFQRLV